MFLWGLGKMGLFLLNQMVLLQINLKTNNAKTVLSA